MTKSAANKEDSLPPAACLISNVTFLPSMSLFGTASSSISYWRSLNYSERVSRSSSAIFFISLSSLDSESNSRHYSVSLTNLLKSENKREYIPSEEIYFLILVSSSDKNASLVLFAYLTETSRNYCSSLFNYIFNFFRCMYRVI
jgi:hypothetical protein